MPLAGDGRESPLKYTGRADSAPCAVCWGWPRITAQVHLQRADAACTCGWGWPRITAQVHSQACYGRRRIALGMAENRRSSTLTSHVRRRRDRAGDGRESPLKYTDAARMIVGINRLGMAENRRSSTLEHRASIRHDLAGDGRESPLKYTATCSRCRCAIGWGWPRIAAQVHLRLGVKHTQLRWGWPRIAAQVH